MQYHPLCVVLSLLLAHAGFARRVDYRVNLLDESTGEPTTPKPTPTVPDCKNTTGAICSGCEKVYTCIKAGGNYKPIFSRSCGTTESCMNGVCTTDPNPVCSPVFRYTFVCNSLGMFPDPLDCKKYYFCYPKSDDDLTPQLSSAKCNAEYGYNSKTTYCGNKLVNDKCPIGFPVPVCNKTGDTGALKDNPSIYFVCLPYSETQTDLYPFMFACDNGGTYDAKTYGCK